MKLSEVQADAIQELGNIGAAHAATTLSQMLGSTIEMSVPAIKVVDLAQLGEYMGEESAAMVAFELRGKYLTEDISSFTSPGNRLCVLPVPCLE